MNILFLLKPKNSVAYFEEDQTLKDGLTIMHKEGYTAIPVISKDGSYAGTVSEGDFLWQMLKNKKTKTLSCETSTIREILRDDFNRPVRINATMQDLLQKVMDQNFVPVVDDRDLFMGIITRKDIINYFYKKELQEGSF